MATHKLYYKPSWLFFSSKVLESFLIAEGKHSDVFISTVDSL